MDITGHKLLKLTHRSTHQTQEEMPVSVIGMKAGSLAYPLRVRTQFPNDKSNCKVT